MLNAILAQMSLILGVCALPALAFGLLYPAYRLAGREFVGLPLFVAPLLYASALTCVWLGSYSPEIVLALPLLATLLLLLPKFRAAGGSPAQGLVPFSRDASALALYAAAGGMLLVGLVMNLRAPLSGWDAMTYHVEFPLQWLQNDFFAPGVTGYGDRSPPYYPALTQLWNGWWLQAGPAGFRSVDALGLFWWAVLWIVLREILYARPGARDEPRLTEAVALCAGLTPYFTSATLTAENDLMLSACFALAWRTLTPAAQGEAADSAPSPNRRALHAGLACGALAAVKYTGIVYLLALLILRGPELARALKTRNGGWKTAGMVGIALVAFLGAGGWWYARNFWITGNPLYPGQVVLPGTDTVLFAGYYTREFFAAHPFHVFTAYDFFSDPGFAPLFWTACVLTFVHRKGALFRAWLLPAAIVAAFLFLVPLRLPRLLGPLAVALAPLLLDGLVRLRHPLRFWIPATGCCLFIALYCMRLAELYGGPFDPQLSLTDFTRATVRYGLNHLSETAAFAGITFATGAACFLLLRIERRLGRRMIIAATLAAVFAIAGLLSRQSFTVYEKRGDGIQRAWAFWESYHSGAGAPAVLGLVGSNAITPWRGINGARRVHLLNSRPQYDRPLHERTYGSQTEAVPRRPVPERELFFQAIANKRITAVAVTTRTGVRPRSWHPERAWLRAAGWRLIHANDDTEFYLK